MAKIRTGIPAFLDSFAGLVPCVALSYFGEALEDGPRIEIKLTATRGPWKRGQHLHASTREAVPRTAVFRSRQYCGQYRIRRYDWRAIFDALQKQETEAGINSHRIATRQHDATRGLTGRGPIAREAQLNWKGK